MQRAESHHRSNQACGRSYSSLQKLGPRSTASSCRDSIDDLPLKAIASGREAPFFWHRLSSFSCHPHQVGLEMGVGTLRSSQRVVSFSFSAARRPGQGTARGHGFCVVCVFRISMRARACRCRLMPRSRVLRNPLNSAGGSHGCGPRRSVIRGKVGPRRPSLRPRKTRCPEPWPGSRGGT